MSVNIQYQGKFASIITFTGKRCSGKSYFLKNAIIPQIPSFILWDVNHEHQFPNVPITYKQEEIIPLFQQYRKVVYRPLDKSTYNFTCFCRICSRLHDYALIIEEVERYATRWSSPEPFNWIIDTGRHRGIALLVTCRRPADLAARIKSNSDYVFMFHQHMTNDIDYLVDWTGEEAYSLKDIEQYGFLIYSDVQGGIIGKYKI